MDINSITNAVKVIIIDSNENVEQMLHNLLDQRFISVPVKSASEAMSYLEMYYSQVALIIVNTHLHGLNMVQLMEDLKGKGVLEDIPVIAISGYPTEEDKNFAYDLGVADYLDVAKPRDSAAKRVRNMLKVYMEARAREIFQTEFDPLTGALNLAGLRRRFQESLFLNPKDKYRIVYTDLMDFKYFNSLYGFEEGNRLLCYWVQAINKILNENDMIARISGDRVVVVRPLEKDDVFVDPLDDLLRDVREHFKDDFAEYEINVVTGIYVYEPSKNRGESFDEMIGYARQAQKAIKGREASGSIFFDDKMWERQQRRMEINGHVDTALKTGEIFLNLQPQYNCVTGELIGAECLCRWIHKTQGFISPGEFIPALEESGKIYDVDFFVWEEACKLIRKWLDEGNKISLSVNVSRKDLEHADLPEVFDGLIKKYNLTPDMLRIEITETAYMDDAGRLTELIRRFAQLGFTVEMDDFGSGFSSLNLLHKSEFDILKLDMGFLSDESTSAKSGSIIQALVKMAHALNMKVLAEGVETLEQAQFLRDIGCIMVQGYFFSRPISVEDFEKLIKESKIEEIKQNYVKYQLFNVQELFDRNSSGFFIFNNCMGAAAMFEYDGETLEPIAVNDDFGEMLDWDVSEIRTQRDLFKDLTPEQVPIVKDLVDKAAENGYAGSEMPSRRSGRTIYVRVRYVCSRDENKIYFTEVSDITDKKRLEQDIKDIEDKHKLQERWYEKKLQALLEMPGTVLYEYDPLKDRMSMTVRRDDGEVVEQTTDKYMIAVEDQGWIHSEDVDRYRNAIRKCTLTGEYQNVAVRAIFKGGEYHNCKYYFTPVMDNDGKIYRVIGRAERFDDCLT